jgi:hypothetical protein
MLEARDQDQPRERSRLAGAPDAAYERALRAELDRRIAALAACTDDDFGGRLGPGDAILAGALFVALPALAIWLGR